MGEFDPWGAFVDRARDVGDEPRTGALAGVRVAVKDNIAVGGLKWTAGLPLLVDRVAAADAPVVEALREAGARIVGTVTTDSAGFGMMTPGVVNPLARDRTVGGSSGGSAAALAAGLADVALGTDTAGSVRVPAACCGLWGLKPSFGRVPTDGVTPLSFTFDHVGLLATGLAGLSRAFDVVSAGEGDIGGGRRIGFDPARLMGTDEAARVAIEEVLQRLAAEGHELVEVELPDRYRLAEVHGIIVCSEARSIWSQHWPRDASRFSETARRSLEWAASIADDEVAEARAQLAEMRAEIARVFEACDAVLGATIAVTVPAVGARKVVLDGKIVPVVMGLLAETCPWNVSGGAALAVPLARADGGIPISLQIATARGGDEQALALAQRLIDVGAATP